MDATRAVSDGSTPGTLPKVKVTRRQPPPLPAMASATDMVDAQFSCKVDTTPCNWSALPLWASFSLCADGSYLKVKVSKSQFCDLRTNQSTSAGSGRCYRVFF